MSNLRKMLDSFKTDEEFKVYIEAQQQTFVEMSKKIKVLEDEKAKLAQENDKLKREQVVSKVSQFEDQNISNAELICLTQVQILKNVSDERALTLEESKKLEIYYKILGQIAASKNNDDSDLKNKSTEELLKELTVITGGSNG